MSAASTWELVYCLQRVFYVLNLEMCCQEMSVCRVQIFGVLCHLICKVVSDLFLESCGGMLFGKSKILLRI